MEPKTAKQECGPTETACDAFTIEQLGESIKLISELHRILHTVVPVLVTADVACFVASLQYNNNIYIAIGGIFPLIIYFYVSRVRKMSLAPFLTGISIEQAYGKKGISYLLSFYMSFVYDSGEYDRIVEISKIPGNRERVDALKKLKFNRNFGKRTLYMIWVPLLALLQFAGGLISYFILNPDHWNNFLTFFHLLHQA
jgi:hypothetical protein